MEYILKLENVSVGNEEIKILKSLNFEVKEKEVISIVGESGCGKSMTLRTILKILPQNLKILNGKIYFKGKELTSLTEYELQKIRGKEIAMIFQEPSAFFNPLFTIGNQIEESIKLKINSKEKKKKIMDILKEMGLPEETYYQYPHQLSGGMLQRAMIAMALINNPALLLADEPTTALDITTAFGIINLLKNLVQIHNLSIIFVTHDITLAKYICDIIIVMYAGIIVELGPSNLIYEKPLHPYTQKLIECLPEKYKRGERINVIEGEVPSFKNLPLGCPFFDRCNYRMKICKEEIPKEITIGEIKVRCFRYGNTVEG